MLRRGPRRYYRTLFLGVAALAALVWVAVDQFEIPWEDMRELMLFTLLVMGLVICVAALGAAAWLGLRKLLHYRRED